ncbi:MAG: tetratricopeptide repeat protein [bacterium]|nr:tetratricopeptide repeat protein [bacterium]
MTTRALSTLLLLALLGPAATAQDQADPAAADPPASSSADATPEVSPGEPWDGTPGEVFFNANAAYEAGRYRQTIDAYEQLLEHGTENGHVHYNLGNAYLRNGELGRAIASYRRGRAFLPRDQDVQANLEFARKSAKDALAPPEPGAVSKTLFFWHHGLSRAELGALVVALNLLLWIILILRLYRRQSEALRWIFVALLLTLATAGVSLGLRHLKPPQVAVVVPQEVDVRSGTSPSALVLFKLHAGTEVRMVDRRDEALRIALPEEGRGGWIATEHAELVTD